MRRIHLFISGRVQGVFFRARTKEKAEQLRLNGWVKNLHDGRVEALFEGDTDAITHMIDWCKKGPLLSSVTRVDIIEEPFTGDFSSFSIQQ